MLKQFRRNYSDPNRKPICKGIAKYQALKHTCQCCPKADARKITREEHEDARQVARDIAKTKQYEISMRLRKKVEMLFAHLNWDGSDYVLHAPQMTNFCSPPPPKISTY